MSTETDPARGLPAQVMDAPAQARIVGEVAKMQWHDAQGERDRLRAELVAEAAGRQHDRAVARQSLARAQDLEVERFRLRDQLSLARLEADEAFARVCDLQVQARELEAQRDDARVQLACAREQQATTSAQLSQAMAIHQQDAVRRQDELDRARHVHQRQMAEAGQHSEASLRRLEAALEDARGRADAMADKLGDVLSSRSWRLTRGLRQLVERMRGRRWVEPQAPPARVDARRAVTRAGDEQGDG